MPLCVYCGRAADSREHWLPRALGRFKGYEQLVDRVCVACNQQLGALEDDFAHASPEAVFRERLGIRGRKKHRKVSPFYHRTTEDQPVRVLAHPPSSVFPFLVEVKPGEVPSSPLRQVILRDGNGRFHQYPIPPNPRPEILAKQVRNVGLQVAAVHAVYAKRHDMLEIQRYLSRVFHKFGPTEFHDLDTDDAPEQARGIATIGISVAYVRAIAKIAFHYVLKQFPHIDGAAAEFADLRAFITQGGEWQHFVEFPSRQFVEPLAHGAIPRHWGHLLAAEAPFDDLIVARLQFFNGPEYLAPVWLVRVGRNPSRVAPPMRVGHYAFYYPKPTKEHDGEIDTLTGAPVGPRRLFKGTRWGWRRGQLFGR